MIVWAHGLPWKCVCSGADVLKACKLCSVLLVNDNSEHSSITLTPPLSGWCNADKDFTVLISPLSTFIWHSPKQPYMLFAGQTSLMPHLIEISWWRDSMHYLQRLKGFCSLLLCWILSIRTHKRGTLITENASCSRWNNKRLKSAVAEWRRQMTPERLLYCWAMCNAAEATCSYIYVRRKLQCCQKELWARSDRSLAHRPDLCCSAPTWLLT